MTKAEYRDRYSEVYASDIIKSIERYADREDVSLDDLEIKIAWANIEDKKPSHVIAEFPMLKDFIGGKHNPPTKAIRIVAIK